MISADVTLDDDEPLIGSFTIDSLTYSVGPNGLTLVSADPVTASDSFVSIPESVVYNGVTYPVTAIAPYAFYLSGVTHVDLPATVTSVNERAFRSSDVERVDAVIGNPNYASFDGALYDASLSRLLLIPEGRKGSVLLSCETEVVEASLFSHCSLVDAIAVEEGGAAFSSWNGLLYDASGQTLLRVPAGATEIMIRDGCTTIAAGALEGCASLERIDAPASVTSISPDVFTSVPTISLPAAALSEDIPQLTAVVALSTTDNDLLKVEPDAIKVLLPESSDASAWQVLGFGTEMIQGDVPIANLSQAASYDAFTININANGGKCWVYDPNGTILTTPAERGSWYSTSGGGITFWSQGAIEVGNVNGNTDWRNIGVARTGYTHVSWSGTFNFICGSANIRYASSGTINETANWSPISYTVKLDSAGGTVSPTSVSATYDQDVTLPTPNRGGYRFLSWNTAADGSGTAYPLGTVRNLTAQNGRVVTLYAQWERDDFDLGFDVDSEPGEEDYPGEPKPDQVVNSADDQVPIEDPKRPGYVFEGWVIPNANGTETVDQDLVYQDEDGKWYVDASKLPDYAGDDGRVELTARWTSVISVDVPQSVTFYADTVTQNQGSREGAASSAFGQNRVANQSQVDLRVVGLESSAVETTGTTLGADSILKKADVATPSTSAQKLLSLYPSTKQWTADELQDPDAVGGTKAGNTVDFDLDDILLEKSFPSDAFTIPAGDTLNMGYRLNLTETGQQLDYDKLATLEDGQSAAIANVSYMFSVRHHHLNPDGIVEEGGSGSAILRDGSGDIVTDECLFITEGSYWWGLDKIKDAAECISEHGETSPCYEFYHSFLTSGMDPSDVNDAHGYVKWGDGATYSVRIIGINYDDRADGTGKAPFTFEFVNLVNTPYQMNPVADNAGEWAASRLRDHMNPYNAGELLSASGTGYNGIWDDVPIALRKTLVPVGKKYYRTYNDLGTLARSNDYLFLKGLGEAASAFHTSGTWNTEHPFLYGERPDSCDAPYPYYALLNLDQMTSSMDQMACGFEKDPSNPVRHWQRSLYVDYSFTFCSFERLEGGPMSGTKSTGYYGVKPAFCL